MIAIISRLSIVSRLSAARLSTSRLAAAAVAATLVGAGLAGSPARARELGVIVGAPTTGVDCRGPLAKTFPRVWLGHFTGGYSHYTGPGGTILLDWRDEKLCFPSRQSCDRWVRGLRSDYHHPEGYFTCLTIR